MCTVSYIPFDRNGDFILTSNRDEKVFRPAIAPMIYDTGGVQICYPKDSLAGGSWIAMNNMGRICCLLNGAIEAHEKQAFHTISRGEIPIELATSHLEPQEYFIRKDLSCVEPFTLISIDQNRSRDNSFSEFIWDGKEKHFRGLDYNKPYIWSSATLYTMKNRELRKEWFNRFLLDTVDKISDKNVLAFHSGTHSKNKAINVVMERDGGLKTVSITQVISNGDSLSMKYSDLIENSLSEVIL